MNKTLTIFWIICVILTTILNVFICYCLNQINIKIDKIKLPEPEVITIEKNISPIPYKNLGTYTISHYCDCPICTKTAKGSKTATGTKPKENRTIACDGKILKMGDIVYIQGYGIRVCEDKGGAVTKNRIDVYINNHDKALKMGIKKARVYLLK